MIYEAHCLTCDTVTNVSATDLGFMRHDSPVVTVQHTNLHTGEKCRSLCIMCLKEEA